MSGEPTARESTIVTIPVLCSNILSLVSRFALLPTQILKETDVGVLMSGVGLLLGVFEHENTMEPFLILLDDLIRCLRAIVMPEQRESRFIIRPEHVYYTVRAPWLQVKLLRALQFYPPAMLGTRAEVVNEVLTRLLNRKEEVISAVGGGVGGSSSLRSQCIPGNRGR